MTCRGCGGANCRTFLDLGFSPPSNAYLKLEDLEKPEKYFPLKLRVCEDCWLLQTEDYAEASDLFSEEYAYFSSISQSWLKHAEQYCIDIIQELGLTRQSMVVEIASNDGYLLKNFLNARIPCLGVEPTKSTASAAKKLGIPVIEEFFSKTLGEEIAVQYGKADLIAGNNVYAHVPDINDFTRGLKALLKPNGTITLEFPHALELIMQTQFDTIYHEHFSYLSLHSAIALFEASELRIWKVELLSTHGGSLRVFGCHMSDSRPTQDSVAITLDAEKAGGLREISTYLHFQSEVNRIKDSLLIFLIEQKKNGTRLAAYGAAAKGNTLLNYAGVRPDLIPYVADASPAKQNTFMAGSHIPIVSPENLIEHSPDVVLILPWNISREIVDQLKPHLPKTVFVVAVPKLQYVV